MGDEEEQRLMKLRNATKSPEVLALEKELTDEHTSQRMYATSGKRKQRSPNVQKSMAHLTRAKGYVLRDDVTSVNVNDGELAEGDDTTRLFLYEQIPRLKFHNPDRSIVCTRD